jgi:hypothetical protein
MIASMLLNKHIASYANLTVTNYTAYLPIVSVEQ